MWPKVKTMFTNQDYIGYFEEIEETLKKTLVIYTDLLNDLDNKAMHSKLYAIATENMDTFQLIKSLKEKFK